MAKQTCKCGTETNVKKDGNLWKHQTPDGVQCDLMEAAYDNGGVLAEGSTHAVNETDDHEEVVVPEAVETEEREDKTPADAGPVFEHTVTVPGGLRSTVDDAKWHQANRELVAVKAKRAGFSPVGEAVLAEQNEEDGKIVLKYSVRVEG